MHPLILAAISGGHKGSPVPQLGSLSDPLQSTVAGTGGNRPQVLIEFQTDGDIAEAVGDTGSALTPIVIGTWLDDVTGLDNTDWEILPVIISEDNGDPGTWTGSAFGSFVLLSTLRSFTWSKDVNDEGTANSVLTFTLRQVSNPSNSVTRSNVDYDGIITP